MKIKSLKLKNIRCFDELLLDFNNEHSTKDWVMILGENGVGKSTILRSIAIGLIEESGASGLLADLGSDFIRKGYDVGLIRIDIEPFPGCKENASIETQFSEDKLKEVKVRQTVNPINPKTFNWDSLFACGYGAGRGIGYTESYQEYVITDSVYTLFRYIQPLQNPELNIRRIKSIGIDERIIFSRIEKILMLPEGSMTLDFSGIKVSGPWGNLIPIDALGDGYQSTIGWIIDLFGWKSLFEGKQENIDLDRIINVSGIVMIDEIEQHLHPKWQRSIIRLLREQFPKIQFIVTSHAPLCVVGTTDLKDEECTIVVLDQEENKISTRVASPPRDKRVDQVLTSYLFEMYTTSDNKIKQNIERYNYLYYIERNSQEEAEMKEIIIYLNETLGSAETELEKYVSNILTDSLDNIFNKNLKGINRKNHPAKFELIRQLKNILE